VYPQRIEELLSAVSLASPGDRAHRDVSSLLSLLPTKCLPSVWDLRNLTELD